jgi:hypothetical protein
MFFKAVMMLRVLQQLRVEYGRFGSFPPHLVTSNLASAIPIARSWPRRTEHSKPQWPAPKPFVLKILTSKFFDIKILQTGFAKPAPGKAFRG